MDRRIRLPYRAGSFYAASEGSLRKQIEGCFMHPFGPQRLPKVSESGERRVVALISPHAGYMYSGPVAAKGYFHLAEDGRPNIIVLIGPNHTGYGSGVSIMTSGHWRTPLGDVQINSDLATAIQQGSEYLDIDETAHRYEHSIEIQLPFLQYLYGPVSFVPICMMMQDLEVSRDVGKAIATAAMDKNVLIIASTDLSHYESQSQAEAKDHLALDAIQHLDEAELQHVVEIHNISMCGYGPVSAAIAASKEMGAKKATLLQYKTSGDITGDKRQVVGYAALSISK